ncbi:helix-turn-helix domain-containing protein [Streptomyces sp. AK02-01A]|uniref:helix-turn-helix domain-containing protein n=1 Tax=Streptomyces sp. AK02-01A TaxID=3028648 RepID=UPI0029ADD357|nr:pyridoxamine 5'-phosphate oxidase family protein [Streptomyces sp. AK02-01A]MDX3855303.1 pyridoxamine 5'-phosphate oxidase family protein [Streptomyces sp. AK02-01A]
MPDHTQHHARDRTPSPTRSDLGRRVVARREQLGLTREETAERAGSAPEYIQYVEEQQAAPGTGFLLRLAQALETTVGELTGAGTDLPSGVGRAARHPELITLSAEECRALLSTHGVGRVAVATREGPAVIPVNYVVVDGAVTYRTAPGTAAAAAADKEVAFEVDHIDDAMSKGWSVNVVGTARAVTGDAAARGLDQQAYTEPWAGGDRPLWLSIFPARISGRRIDTASTRPRKRGGGARLTDRQGQQRS